MSRNKKAQTDKALKRLEDVSSLKQTLLLVKPLFTLILHERDF